MWRTHASKSLGPCGATSSGPCGAPSPAPAGSPPSDVGIAAWPALPLACVKRRNQRTPKRTCGISRADPLHERGALDVADGAEALGEARRVVEVAPLEAHAHHGHELRGRRGGGHPRPEPVAHRGKSPKRWPIAASTRRRAACGAPRRARIRTRPPRKARGVSRKASSAQAMSSAAWSSWCRNAWRSCARRAGLRSASGPGLFCARSEMRSAAGRPGRSRAPGGGRRRPTLDSVASDSRRGHGRRRSLCSRSVERT